MSGQPDEEGQRRRAVDVMQAMDACGLNRGASDTVSVRIGENLLAAPSGIPAMRLTPDQMVLVSTEGSTPEGALKSTSEWRMH